MFRLYLPMPPPFRPTLVLRISLLALDVRLLKIEASRGPLSYSNNTYFFSEVGTMITCEVYVYSEGRVTVYERTKWSAGSAEVG